MNRLILLGLMMCGAAMSLKILGIFPYPGKSHYVVFEALFKGLADKGHDVTVLSHFPQQKPYRNYKDISLKGSQEALINVVDLDDIPDSRLKLYGVPLALVYLGYKDCATVLKSSVIKEFLEKKENYDVIIIESFNTDCFLSLVHKLGSPFIMISSSIMMPWNSIHMGNPDNPSYIPNHFMDYSDKLSFFERVENTVINIFDQIIYKFPMQWIGQNFVTEAFGEMIPLNEIAKNASLLFLNSHFTLNLPKPLVPGIIELSGLHIGTPKPLSKVSLFNFFVYLFFNLYLSYASCETEKT